MDGYRTLDAWVGASGRQLVRTIFGPTEELTAKQLRFVVKTVLITGGVVSAATLDA